MLTLPSDDLPPLQPTPLDRLLKLRLQEQVTRHFLQGCDRITQYLLGQCHWSLVNEDPLTLTIQCPDIETYWHIVADVDQLSRCLQGVVNTAKIQIIPPGERHAWIELSLNELSTYWERN